MQKHWDEVHAKLRAYASGSMQGVLQVATDEDVVGCAGAVSPVAPVEPQTRRNRAEYVRPTVTEWYVNGPLGLEQGFTLAQPPRCAPAAGIELEVSTGSEVTAQLHGSGPAESSYVELLDSSHKTWLRYSDVFASDARGRALPTRLAVVNGRIRLSVDDAGAAYPVTIDPLIWTVQQQLQGSDTAAGDFFGRSVSVSGTTAVVGAFQANLPGKTGAGAAYVFVRSGTSWSQQAILLDTASGAAMDSFGTSVSVSGDTAVIGAHYKTVGANLHQGQAYVFVRASSLWTQQAYVKASNTGGAICLAAASRWRGTGWRLEPPARPAMPKGQREIRRTTVLRGRGPSICLDATAIAGRSRAIRRPRTPLRMTPWAARLRCLPPYWSRVRPMKAASASASTGPAAPPSPSDSSDSSET